MTNKKNTTGSAAVVGAPLTPAMTRAVQSIVRTEMAKWQSEFLESVANEFKKSKAMVIPEFNINSGTAEGDNDGN